MNAVNEKVVFITGVRRGLGAALAGLYLERGCRVAGVSRSDEAPELLVKQGLWYFAGNVGDEDRIRQILAEVIRKFGKIDILVCNAGLTIKRRMGEFTRADYEKVFEVNVWGAMNLTQLAIEHEVGHLVFVSSVAGKFGADGYGVYAASKHALEGWVKTLLKEWRGRVTIVRPFRLDTEFSNVAGRVTSPTRHKLPVKWYAEYVVARTMNEKLNAWYWWVRCWSWWGFRYLGGSED